MITVMNKKIVYSFFCTCFIFLILSGCGYSKKEIQYMKKLESQAKTNAIYYIKNKYGFVPNIISTDVEKGNSAAVLDFTPSPTGYIYVNLSYKGKNFEVYISGEKQSKEGFDNYQYDEINRAVTKYISEKTGINSYSNSNNYGIRYYEDNHNGLIKDLFDTYNLEHILENNKFNILVEYIGNSNLEYIKINRVFDNLKKTKIMLVNYNSLESYNKALSLPYQYRESLDENYLRDNLTNIESAYIIESGKASYFSLDGKQFNDIYYYDTDIEKNYSSNISLSYTTIMDVSNWIGKGVYRNVSQISEAYLINGIGQNNKHIIVYIPLKKIQNFNVENIDVGVEYCGNYSTSNISIKGDYLVSAIRINKCDYLSEAKFTLLYSSHEE